MSKTSFVIEGGKPLCGLHETPGNKNAALPMLAAALLSSSPVTIENIPRIADVAAMLDLIESIGARVQRDMNARTAIIDASTISSTELSRELCSKIRTSILLAGPLLARAGHVSMYPPGGDVIGLRRLDTHIEGFEAMGASLSVCAGGTSFSIDAPNGLHGAGKHLLDEASVTGTENLLMAAVMADGESVFFNAACEPHIQNLCEMLTAMGADITGIGTNRLCINGVKALHGATVRVWPDYIESASFLVAAAATHGSVRISPVVVNDFLVLKRPLARLGLHFDVSADGVLSYQYDSDNPPFMQTDFSGAIAKIDDGIWPALPSDLMSVMIVLATQTNGIITFFEKMFESRLYFVDNLIGMGAQIVHCDPHRVVVRGPCRLHGSRLQSPDIRAGMAMIIAGLCAEGRTIIDNAESIDRGYEPLENALTALGADIHRIFN